MASHGLLLDTSFHKKFFCLHVKTNFDPILVDLHQFLWSSTGQKFLPIIDKQSF